MPIELQGVAWIVTYACNLQCAHCFFAPDRRDATAEPASMTRALRSLRESVDWAHLTGGEPLLDPPRLIRQVEAIHKAHEGDIGLATNGWWGRDALKARRLVERLCDAGVTGVCLSVDVLHAVEETAITQAARAVAEAGLAQHSFLVVSVLPSAHPKAKTINTPSLELAGRVASATGLPVAKTEVRAIGRGSDWSTQAEMSIPNGPCRDLACCLGETGPFAPKMVWIDPFGNVMICYGLTIGNVNEQPLQEILDAYDPRRDVLLETLARTGPKGLFALALQHGRRPHGPFRDECDLCFRSRRALRDLYPDILRPRECYPST